MVAGAALLRRVSRMIRVDFKPFTDTGSIVTAATLEDGKRAVGFRYPEAAFALSWRSHYLPNPGWRRSHAGRMENRRRTGGR